MTEVFCASSLECKHNVAIGSQIRVIIDGIIVMQDTVPYDAILKMTLDKFKK